MTSVCLCSHKGSEHAGSGLSRGGCKKCYCNLYEVGKPMSLPSMTGIITNIEEPNLKEDKYAIIKLDENFKIVMDEVWNEIDRKAADKGYGDDEATKLNTLNFVQSLCEGHMEGEMIYKIVRWRAKRNPNDLIKLIAWAFLVYHVSYLDGIRRDEVGGEK